MHIGLVSYPWFYFLMKKKVHKSVELQLKEIKENYLNSKANFSPESRIMIEMLMSLMEVLLLAIGFKKDSSNSHLPPASDPYRKRKKKV